MAAEASQIDNQNMAYANCCIMQLLNDVFFYRSIKLISCICVIMHNNYVDNLAFLVVISLQWRSNNFEQKGVEIVSLAAAEPEGATSHRVSPLAELERKQRRVTPPTLGSRITRTFFKLHLNLGEF